MADARRACSTAVRGEGRAYARAALQSITRKDTSHISPKCRGCSKPVIFVRRTSRKSARICIAPAWIISNRLLFSLYRYQGETYILVLECIANHAYDKSRFLRRGATIDESKIPTVDHPDQAAAAPLAYLNPRLPTFHLLNKVMSFDDAQQAVYTLPPPCIVIGSAGSGKTALTLEKMKDAPGEVLYVTRSPYLVHNARTLYYALAYANDAQDVSFLSFAEYLASLRVPQGREMGVRDFTQWFARHRAASRLKDPHALFEEFQGVITGPATDHPYLSREAYLGLGIRQSIFAADERPHVYDLFDKYLAFLQDNDYYDPNILSYHYMPLVEPRYDFVVVDEVQDLTTIQLQLILTALREPHQFVLCGDANQIVHPNFFSWSTLKRFFYEQDGRTGPADLIRILHNNYRNAGTIIDLANRVLTLKHARFGSVDRESNYLVHSTVETAGTVRLLADSEPITRELNRENPPVHAFCCRRDAPGGETGGPRPFPDPPALRDSGSQRAGIRQYYSL